MKMWEADQIDGNLVNIFLECSVHTTLREDE